MKGIHVYASKEQVSFFPLHFICGLDWAGKNYIYSVSVRAMKRRFTNHDNSPAYANQGN